MLKRNLNLLYLSLISFLFAFGTDLVFPILPFYITNNLGLSLAIIGFFEGFIPFFLSLFDFFSGWFSDFFKKRKIFVVIGYLFSVFGRIILIFTNKGWQFFLARFLERSGKGIRHSTREILLIDSTSSKEWGRAIGILKTSDGLGSFLGSLFCVLLLIFLKINFRLIFLVSFLPILFAFLFSFKLKDLSLEKNKSNFYGNSYFANNFFFLFLMLFFLNLVKNRELFLLLRVKELKISIFFIPVLWAVYHLGISFFSFPMGIVSDRIGRRRMFIFGLIYYVILNLGFAFIVNPAFFWILFLLCGLQVGVFESATRIFVLELVDKNNWGKILGFLSILDSLGSFFIIFLQGLLWQFYGAKWAFVFSAIVPLFFLPFFKKSFK